MYTLLYFLLMLQRVRLRLSGRIQRPPCRGCQCSDCVAVYNGNTPTSENLICEYMINNDLKSYSVVMSNIYTNGTVSKVCVPVIMFCLKFKWR